MKLKNLDYLSNLLFDNYTLLQIVKNITINRFFIVLNICNMSNNVLLDLKNDLYNYGSKSMVIKAKYIKILFSNYFTFFKSACMCIFINDMSQFFNIIKILKNLSFFYSFNKAFSNITNSDTLLYQHNIYSSYISLHYTIFKLINNIILILLYYIALFNQLLKKNTIEIINNHEKKN
jgi:hypothetical protein